MNEIQQILLDNIGITVVVFLIVMVILVIGPLRKFAAWLLLSSWKPLVGTIKVILHVLGRSHRNVVKNFLPRQKIIYELNQKRTSHTKRD